MRRLLFSFLCLCFIATSSFGQTSGSPGGLVVFETFNSTNATNATQATVLAGVMSTDTVLFANANLQLARDLGIAIVNPNSVAANATLNLRNAADGSIASVITLTIGAHQQISQFLSQIFATLPTLSSDFVGTLSVTTDNPVAITALRFRGTNFSTIPITNLSSAELLVPQLAPGIGGPMAVILPQFATGGGNWSSNLVISNTSALPVTVRVDFFQQNGTPLTTVLNGTSGSSFPNVVIPAAGILIDNNNDPNPKATLQVGYAVVTPLDVVPPTVISAFPANGSVNVATDTPIAASFSKAMVSSTINSATFTLQAGSTSTQGTITYTGNTATLTPAVPLSPNTLYTATVTTGAQDSIAGVALVNNFVWSFTTAAGVTNPPPVIPPLNPSGPQVTNIFPVNAATGVALNTNVDATFSESTMNPATIGPATFLLSGPTSATSIVGTVAYNVLNGIATATFTPSTLLTLNTTYTATLTTGIMDLAGHALTSNFVWTFKTVAAQPAGPASVALGAAAPYAILAYSAVTLTPSSTVNGSLGITNSTATGLTGCTAGCVITGTQDFSNSATAAAKTALVNAYNAAVLAAGPSIALTGGEDLGSPTVSTIATPLPPGLYISGSSLQVGNGETLYLSSNDPNATWIFQMPSSTLTMNPSSKIVLQGNASAANIFWQVGSSATLNTAVTFYGNIVAAASIIVDTGTVVTGRLLAGETGGAGNGSVTLQTNTTVTVPTP